MARKLTLMLVGVLVVTLLSVGVLAEKPVKFKLTVTDGGAGFLTWFESISVFPYNAATKKTDEKPVVVVKPVLKVVQLELAPGDYEIVITMLGRWRGNCEEVLATASWGKVNLSKDQVFDFYKVGIPTKLQNFVPSEVVLR